MTHPCEKSPGITRSYHRPLQDHIEVLFDAGLAVECLKGLPAAAPRNVIQERRIERLARENIPLFLGLRAVQITGR